MSKVLSIILACIFVVVPTYSKQYEDGIKILSWDNLAALTAKERSEYIYKLSEIFFNLDSRDAQTVALRERFLEFVLGQTSNASNEALLTELRNLGKPCIFSGNASTYIKNANNQIRCKPVTSFKMCNDIEYKCTGGKALCNPLIFGFKNNEKIPSADFDGNKRKIKYDESSKKFYYVNGELTAANKTADNQVYSEPFCVDIPRNKNLTLACHNISNLSAPAATTSTQKTQITSREEKDFFSKNVSWFHYNMKQIPKCKDDIKTKWNSFAEAANTLCSDKYKPVFKDGKECEVIKERADLLFSNYYNSSPAATRENSEYKKVNITN